MVFSGGVSKSKATTKGALMRYIAKNYNVVRQFAKGGSVKAPIKVKQRLEAIRKSIQNENVSYGELVELQSLSQYIDSNDIELRQAADIPEFDDDNEMATGGSVGNSQKGYGIIEYASDMISYDGYFDPKELEKIMQRDKVTNADVLASWKSDWDKSEWTGSQIKSIKSLGASKMATGGEVDEDDDFEVEEELTYLKLSNSDVVVEVVKRNGNWVEGSVLEGEKPYGWGGKRYMGYLHPNDIINYLNSDYKTNFRIVEQYAKGGSVSNYPSFEVAKTIRVDDMNITPGYYTYMGRENGGKGVYLNVHTKQTLGFDLDMLKSLNEKHPTDIQILMKKGGRVKKGNYSYIPQQEIDYLVTEYGKKIDGNKLLDGAYAKGNTKAPKMVRTQFEEEDYEFEDGGEIKFPFEMSDPSVAEKLRKYIISRFRFKKDFSPNNINELVKKYQLQNIVDDYSERGNRYVSKLFMNVEKTVCIYYYEQGSYTQYNKCEIRFKNKSEFDSFDKKMAKGGSVKKGNYSYIPQEEIDYLVTEYGKKIDGNKLLDGAYAKGNTKAPKITRTQFEEEDYEFAKGGEIGKIIGKTKNGNLIYENANNTNHNKFSKEEHLEAVRLHRKLQQQWARKRGPNPGYIDGKPTSEAVEKTSYHGAQMMSHQHKAKQKGAYGTKFKMETGGSMSSKINYQNDDFALVVLGGSIGSKTSLPIFVNGKMGSIVESGNNKEMLKEKAARMRKQLSAGERKHYGMSYTVVALTPAKVKEIERLKNK